MSSITGTHTKTVIHIPLKDRVAVDENEESSGDETSPDKHRSIERVVQKKI